MRIDFTGAFSCLFGFLRRRVSAIQFCSVFRFGLLLNGVPIGYSSRSGVTAWGFRSMGRSWVPELVVVAVDSEA